MFLFSFELFYLGYLFNFIYKSSKDKANGDKSKCLQT